MSEAELAEMQNKLLRGVWQKPKNYRNHRAFCPTPLRDLALSQEQANPKAQYNLAVSYENGEGLEYSRHSPKKLIVTRIAWIKRSDTDYFGQT